jgi:diacylglycerol kinase family enzyme
MVGDCTDLTVRSAAGSIEIALDGEVLRLASPLHFAIERAALRVVVPQCKGEDWSAVDHAAGAVASVGCA